VVLKYFQVGLEHAFGRYLEEMMTKLGSTASQGSPATPKHRIIICSYIDQTQWGSKLRIQIVVMAEYKKNSAAKRFITTSQLSDLLRPNFGEKF